MGNEGIELPFDDIWDVYKPDTKLNKLTLNQLILKLEELNKKSETDESSELFEEIEILQDTIGLKLGLISIPMFRRILEQITDESKAMEERIMSKVRNHRHDTSKVFTGRAEY